MIILGFLELMAKSKKAVTILSVGSMVAVTVTGSIEPEFTIPCATCQSADILSSALEDCYIKNLG